MLLLAVCLTAPAARADKRDRHAKSEGGDSLSAQRIFSRGLKHFRQRRYHKALKLFLESNTLAPHANKLYNIAECYRRLGKVRQSHDHYVRYARSLPGDRQAAFTEKLRKLRWGAPCTLSVASTPGGAAVTVDGKQAGKTPARGAPLTVTVAGGEHQLELKLQGHRAARRKVTAEFGEPQAFSFALEPLPRPMTLDVRSNVTAARVKLDGQDTGQVPLQLTLSPGEHTVEVFAPRHRRVVRKLVARAGAAEQMYLELNRVQALGPGEADIKKPPLRQPAAPRRRGLFIQAMMGPAWADYGDDRLEASAAIELGLRAGWLWRLGRLGVSLDAGVSAVPVTDGGNQATGWFVSFLGGAGARLYLWRELWLGLHFSAGLSALDGAPPNIFLFEGSSEVSGTFPVPMVRPEVNAGWTIWRGLTVYLTPFALDYSPPHEAFTKNIQHVLRYHVAAGLGWQL